MNVVDSCGWLEYFADGINAAFFAPAIQDVDQLIVPTLCLYEVFKVVKVQRGKQAALHVVSMLYSGQILPLNDELALHAAEVSLEYRLPMADSIIYASARSQDATLWTQDEHFKDLPGLKYIEKG
jgi:predicted nucleic acid-binding protein